MERVSQQPTIAGSITHTQPSVGSIHLNYILFRLFHHLKGCFMPASFSQLLSVQVSVFSALPPCRGLSIVFSRHHHSGAWLTRGWCMYLHCFTLVIMSSVRKWSLTPISLKVQLIREAIKVVPTFQSVEGRLTLTHILTWQNPWQHIQNLLSKSSLSQKFSI